MNTDEFIKKAKIVHNNTYTYDNAEYKSNKDKITITCKMHGNFEQLPFNHLRGYRCPGCFGKIKYDNTSFIVKCNGIHNNKYDYSKVNYVNNKAKIIIICPVHGEFSQKACHHLAGKECIHCAALARGKERSYDSEEFKTKASIKHNCFYNYEKVEYIRSFNKVRIICPNHGEFQQLPANHLLGQGCPKCSSSSGETLISSYLTEMGILFEAEKRFDDCKNKKPLPFDFYIESMNVCIEYDGEQHFRVVEYFGGERGYEKRKINDSIKSEYCRNNNITLIRIRYDENIISILDDKLNFKK